MNRTIRLTFYSTLFILLLLIQSFNSSLSAQNKGGRSVTTQLKELTSKYKIKLSFNPALTDTIYTNIRLAGSSFALDLEQLLQDTGLEFRGVGRQFVVYKAIIEEEEEEESALVLPPPVEKRLVRDINPLSENDFLEESFSADVTPLQMLHSLRKGRLHDGGYYTNYSPRFAIKTNVLYDLTGTINVGAEVALAPDWTIDISFNYNPWTYTKDRKLQNLIIQPELRWWENARFDGHFFGVHFVWGNYHVANVISDRLVKLNNYPVGVKGYVNNNWEGSMLGGGVSYGYYWPLRHNWGVEASMGIGYIHFDTKKYRSETPKPDKASCTNYFGLTKLSVAVVYTIK